MRVGIAHHFGWAVAVTASPGHVVVDRRRLELLGPGLPAAPIHHREGGLLDDEAMEALVARVRAAATEKTTVALDELAAAVPGSIESISLRAWPPDFPTEISVLRRAPFESQADSVMYREVLAGLARERGWEVCMFDAKLVEAQASTALGERAGQVLHGPREALGPPWNKDHRIALAATIVAGRASGVGEAFGPGRTSAGRSSAAEPAGSPRPGPAGAQE